MGTHGILCFTNIEKKIILNSSDIEKILEGEVKIRKHSDGYNIGGFLSDFLKDEGLRRDQPEYLTAWALYELMSSDTFLSHYEDEHDKREYQVETYKNICWFGDAYVYVVVEGSEVLLYKHGEFKGIYTLDNLEELKDIEFMESL